jgi:AcrR family transcriptional regulator
MQSAMLRVPVQERAQKTRADVLAAAARAFAEHGYERTNARVIAEFAGVATGTFYQYFQDKDAALAEICVERTRFLAAESDRIVLELPTDVVVAWRAYDAIERVVELSLQYHRRDPRLHAVIEERRVSDSRIGEIMRTSEEHSIRKLAEALTFFQFDGDVEATAFMMFSLLEGAIHAHVLSHAVLDDLRFVTALVEALWRIGTPASLLSHLHANPAR